MTYEERIAECQKEIRQGQPWSPEYAAEQFSLRAAEMARAEQRRNPQPQLELPA